MKHNMGDLYQMQSLPLNAKINMTITRVRGWLDHWDDDCYISFSGGKDSTVLVDIIHNKMGRKDIPLVFVDTGLEYPEIREFVKTYGDKVTWLRPKMNFRQVIEKYGYPFISKEVSECVQGARKYLTKLHETETVLTDRQTDRIPYRYWYERVTGTGNYMKTEIIPSADKQSLVTPTGGGLDNKYRKLRGIGEYSRKQSVLHARKNSNDIGALRSGLGEEEKGDYP